jgi:hypothetical protein
MNLVKYDRRAPWSPPVLFGLWRKSWEIVRSAHFSAPLER